MMTSIVQLLYLENLAMTNIVHGTLWSYDQYCPVGIRAGKPGND